MRATDTDWAGLVLIRARVITHEHSPIEPFKFGASRPDLKPVESMGRFPLAPIGYSSVVSSSAILRWLNFLRREELTAEIWHLFSIRKGFGAFLMTSVLHQSLFQYRAGKHACKKTCGGEVEISFAHFTWKYIFIPALPRKGQWQFCQFSLWVVFSLCNISIYRNIIIHWFRILDFFFPFSESHIYSSLLWQLRELQGSRIWRRAASHLSSPRAWSKPWYCSQYNLDQAEGICLPWVCKKKKKTGSSQTSVFLPSVQA